MTNEQKNTSEESEKDYKKIYTTGYSCVSSTPPRYDVQQQEDCSQEPYLRVVNIENQVNEAYVNFLGESLTGPAKIKDSNDIAFIFKNLEGAVNEHAFGVLIFQDRTYKVMYLSTGTTCATTIDTNALLSEAHYSKAKEICLVHNHPSGILEASKADVKIHKNLVKGASYLNIKVIDSVVINLDSGSYLTFNENSNNQVQKNEVERKVKRLKIRSFNKRLLYQDREDRSKITSSEDAAIVLSQIKRGSQPKMGIVFMDNANTVCAVNLYGHSTTHDKVLSDIASGCGRYGSNVILFSNCMLSESLVERTKGLQANVNLLDVIVCEKNEDILKNYISYANNGIKF